MIPQIFPVWYAFAWFHGRAHLMGSVTDDPDSTMVAINLYWKTGEAK